MHSVTHQGSSACHYHHLVEMCRSAFSCSMGPWSSLAKVALCGAAVHIHACISEPSASRTVLTRCYKSGSSSFVLNTYLLQISENCSLKRIAVA